MSERDTVILKGIAVPTLKGLDTLMTRARKQARKAGLKQKDVTAAIARLRGRT